MLAAFSVYFSVKMNISWVLRYRSIWSVRPFSFCPLLKWDLFVTDGDANETKPLFPVETVGAEYFLCSQQSWKLRSNMRSECGGTLTALQALQCVKPRSKPRFHALRCKRFCSGCFSQFDVPLFSFTGEAETPEESRGTGRRAEGTDVHCRAESRLITNKSRIGIK